jgi:hypothetical protein
MLALVKDQDAIELGQVNLNISKFYDTKEKEIDLPIRGDFFLLKCKISVIGLDEREELGISATN